MPRVHFDIFHQQLGHARWSLFESLDDRDLALENARRLLKEGRASAVKVVKETFDPETGSGGSMTLFEDGHVNLQKKNKKIDDIDDLPPCATADDLYTHDARAVIGRTLAAWLTHNKLTAIELLHSAPALARLDSQGTILQHALQKIAVAQAAKGGRTVTQAVRELSGLCSTVLGRVVKDDRGGQFDGGGPGAFGALAVRLSGKPGAAYRMNGALAKHLAAARSWDAKLKLLLALMDELPQHEEAGGLLLAAIDLFAAEMLANPAALTDLLGPAPDLGHTVLKLLALFLGADSPDSDARSPAAQTLAGLFGRDMLTGARTTIAARLNADLHGMKRFCPSSWEQELAMLSRLAAECSRAAGTYLPREDLIAAFVERSRRFVAADPLFQFIADARSTDEKVERLLSAEAAIVGARNKGELATFIAPLIASHAFEKGLAGSVLARLQRVTELQKRVLRSGFEADQKSVLATQLDAVATGIETRAGFLVSLEPRFPDPVDRANALLKLCAAGAFTEGELQGRARREMMAALTTPGFLSAYVARQQKELNAARGRDAALTALTKDLRGFGIAEDEARRAIAA